MKSFWVKMKVQWARGNSFLKKQIQKQVVPLKSSKGYLSIDIKIKFVGEITKESTWSTSLGPWLNEQSSLTYLHTLVLIELSNITIPFVQLYGMCQMEVKTFHEIISLLLVHEASNKENRDIKRYYTLRQYWSMDYEVAYLCLPAVGTWTQRKAIGFVSQLQTHRMLNFFLLSSK